MVVELSFAKGKVMKSKAERQMNIWIVEKGENYEGGTVICVCNSKNLAIKKALESPCSFPGGWVKDKEEDMLWGNGCDYVTVRRFKISTLEKEEV